MIIMTDFNPDPMIGVVLQAIIMITVMTDNDIFDDDEDGANDDGDNDDNANYATD